MKKMKFLCITLILIFGIFGLTGCKNNENDNANPEDITNKINISSKEDDSGITKIIEGAKIEEKTSGENQVNQGESGELVSGDEEVNLGLYSSENRAVFNFGNVYYVIYDFDGEKISNFSYCYMYEDEAAGELAYNYFMDELNSSEGAEDEKMQDIKEIKREGKYIIISMRESTYSDLTKKDVMDAYSYLEQIYEK